MVLRQYVLAIRCRRVLYLPCAGKGVASSVGDNSESRLWSCITAFSLYASSVDLPLELYPTESCIIDLFFWTC